MQTWLKISLLLCIFGFLKEIRPSDPFIFEFLIGEWRNVTAEQVQQEVYPVAIYSYLIQLFIVFLITDLLRYKPLIVALGFSGIIVWGMLLWTESLLELQILEAFYGTYLATEVAYFTYIYAKVPKENYPHVTAHTRAAILAGRALSGILGQLLISFDAMDYRQLNYITFAAMIAASIWAFILPSVQQSVYFHRPHLQNTGGAKYKAAFKLMRKHFVDSFSDKYVLKWSIWWTLTTSGFTQVQTYIQPLWAEIHTRSSDEVFNGAVEAVLTLLGVAGALVAGFVKINWKRKGEVILTVCSLASAALILIGSQTNELFVSYACYVVFGGVYYFMITVASAEIARFILEDSYGLVFGLNTFLALALQTLMTLFFVTGDAGVALNPRSLYIAYGVYHVVIAVVFIIIGITIWVRNNRAPAKAATTT